MINTLMEYEKEETYKEYRQQESQTEQCFT